MLIVLKLLKLHSTYFQTKNKHLKTYSYKKLHITKGIAIT